MGCQCAKPQEQTNLNLETAPPKSSEEQIIEAPKADTVNHSKIENSVNKSSTKKGGKKKVTKKAKGKIKNLNYYY